VRAQALERLRKELSAQLDCPEMMQATSVLIPNLDPFDESGVNYILRILKLGIAWRKIVIVTILRWLVNAWMGACGVPRMRGNKLYLEFV
jgi:hypothetical protein